MGFVAKARGAMDEYAYRTNSTMDTAKDIAQDSRFKEIVKEEYLRHERENKEEVEEIEKKDEELAKKINSLDFSKAEKLTIDHKYVKNNEFKESLSANVDEKKAIEKVKKNKKEKENELNKG